MALLSPVPHEIDFRVCGLRHGIPSWLMAGMSKQAAQHRRLAESPRGARGLLQVMPNVATAYGVDPDALWDPRTNLCLAAKLLAIHKQRIKQRYGVSGSTLWHFVMAANNAGWSKVKPRIDALGPNPRWEGFRTAPGPVSVDHIERMWGYASRYRNLDLLAYGIVALAATGAAYAYITRSRR